MFICDCACIPTFVTPFGNWWPRYPGIMSYTSEGGSGVRPSVRFQLSAVDHLYLWKGAEGRTCTCMIHCKSGMFICALGLCRAYFAFVVTSPQHNLERVLHSRPVGRAHGMEPCVEFKNQVQKMTTLSQTKITEKPTQVVCFKKIAAIATLGSWACYDI